MYIEIYRKGTKRKVKSFNHLHKIIIVDNTLTVFPLTQRNESFDLSLFDFVILD